MLLVTGSDPRVDLNAKPYLAVQAGLVRRPSQQVPAVQLQGFVLVVAAEVYCSTWQLLHPHGDVCYQGVLIVRGVPGIWSAQCQGIPY